MENILQQKIQENEKVYTDAKAALDKIIGNANSDYKSLLSDYKRQIEYIKNNSMLTDDGKRIQATKVHDDFLKKVTDKAVEYSNSLKIRAFVEIKSIDDDRIENNDVLNLRKIPQIIYVSAMMNSISQLQDASMLKEVFEYACLEGNFGTEVINLIYMRANSLLNAANGLADGKVVVETQSEAQERILNESINVNKIISDGQLKTILTAIITEINKYKHDYTKEFNDFKSTFESWERRKVYPQSLYLAIDPRDDFRLESNLNKDDAWNSTSRNNNPWNK